MSDKMMRVQKRNGSTEEVSFDKVLNRIRKISDNLNVNIFDIAQKVCSRIFDTVKTSELDELAAHICSSMITEHPDYGSLGARIIVSNHHKNTSPSFSETVNIMYTNTDVHGEKNPLVSEELYEVVMKNKEKLNSFIDYQRDYLFDYFGFKTLERSYLMKVKGVVVERPQQMFMRVAIGIHGDDVKEALTTYDLMSSKYFTHATPTLFNAGTPRPQLSSCFLLHMENDSIDGVFSTLKDCAMISKYSGGIGLHIHNVRAKGSRIRGTNGQSDGIVPMMRVYNNTARYVNQCFTPDTVVYTLTGPKRMDEVQIGDQLVTIDGSFKNVNTVSINNVDKDILEIRTKYAFETIKVTPEHEMYIISGQRKMTNYDVIRNRLNLGIVQPEFKLAKDLEVDDMVGYPIPQYERDFAIDADLCRLYGIMIGDGSIYKRSAHSLEYKVDLNNTTKVQTTLFVEQYLASKGIHYWVTKETDKDVYSIRWTNQTCGIAYDDLYDDQKNKHIEPKFMHLPKDKTRALIRGLMETDGHQGKELYFHTTSYQVAHAFRYMLLRLGSLCSGFVKDDVGKGHYITRSNGKRTYIETKKLMYVVRVPKSDVMQEILEDVDTEFNGFFTHNGIIWSRIRSIDTAHYTGDVYDFNMMDNHNYTVASFGLVHNSGKRNGSIAMYLEPWHADVEAFLEMKKNHGNEEERARDLFYALWIPDLFMHRVKNNGVWSLMCPDECPGLSDVYGEEFIKLYEKYEAEGRYKKQMKAQDLWWQILQMQIEQGVPYLLFKDAANSKSNQKNLGTIKSSNLCVAPETMVLTKDGSYPIVDLAGKDVEVWNGKQFSKTIVHQTGSNSKLVTVNFSNGVNIRCTPYHDFYVLVEGETLKVKAHELTSGMQVAPFKLPSYSDDMYVTITSVEDKDEYDDTYCFNEPLEHKGVFNGILTGQCSEIIEYTAPDEVAVCNLASIALPSYIEYDENKKPVYNFAKLHEVAKVVTKNLNKVIDINFYPIEKARRSNLKHRPIGLGVQGLADAYVIMRYPFDSQEAMKLNKYIFETIHHGAMEASMEISKKRAEWIAKYNNEEITYDELDEKINLNEYEVINAKYPGAYSTFEGSPASHGQFQFDLWGVTPESGMYDWDKLKADVMQHGIRNSLLLAPMPTASTSQILGFNECFESFTSNLYKRKTLAGEFIIVNKYLINDLVQLGLWDKDMKNKVIINDGSIQAIEEIPDELKRLYKTSWELKQKVIIDQSADRGAYVCQSQSLNLFVEDPDFQKLSSMHFYSWQKGLKTGMYYLRTRAKAQAQKFTIDPNMVKLTNLKSTTKADEPKAPMKVVCDGDTCEYCSG